MMQTRATGAALLAAAAAIALSGCDSFNSGSDEVRYCVDNQNRTVSQQECDRDVAHGGGIYSFVHGPYTPNLPVGSYVDPSQSYTPKFRTNDINARNNAGFTTDTSGKIATGQSVPGKSGGFGSGSGKSGGFGGSGESGG